MRKLLVFFAVCFSALACQAQDAYQTTLDKEVPFMRDLVADLKLAKAQNKPLLILFSQSDCRFCHNVRSQHLKHIATQAKPPVLVREIMHDTAQTLGAESASTFTKRMGIQFFPAVVVYDPNLKRLGDPLLGSDISGFYGAYLEAAIQGAVTAMGQK